MIQTLLEIIFSLKFLMAMKFGGETSDGKLCLCLILKEKRNACYSRNRTPVRCSHFTDQAATVYPHSVATTPHCESQTVIKMNVQFNVCINTHLELPVARAHGSCFKAFLLTQLSQVFKKHFRLFSGLKFLC